MKVCVGELTSNYRPYKRSFAEWWNANSSYGTSEFGKGYSNKFQLAQNPKSPPVTFKERRTGCELHSRTSHSSVGLPVSPHPWVFEKQAELQFERPFEWIATEQIVEGFAFQLGIRTKMVQARAAPQLPTPPLVTLWKKRIIPKRFKLIYYKILSLLTFIEKKWALRAFGGQTVFSLQKNVRRSFEKAIFHQSHFPSVRQYNIFKSMNITDTVALVKCSFTLKLLCS